jgi:Domain of unknown function (DUF4352)
MRAAQLSPAPKSGQRRPGQKPGHPWLRWVPVPLAVLAAAIGALVMGSFQGQVAAANANRPGYQAGGLSLTVDTMLWMSNDMTGQGPGNKGHASFSMAPSMMPGMQAVGENRLRVEVSLNNTTGDTQTYSIGDFSLSAPDGKTFSVDPIGHEDMTSSANLQPGFGTTIDVYFDMPAKQSKNLTLEWSRGGTTVSIPVHTSGSPGPMRM